MISKTKIEPTQADEIPMPIQKPNKFKCILKAKNAPKEIPTKM